LNVYPEGIFGGMRENGSRLRLPFFVSPCFWLGFPQYCARAHNEGNGMQNQTIARLVLIMLFSTLLLGCKESPLSFAKEPRPSLEGGMSQAQVIAVLGEPNGTMSMNGEAVLLYQGTMLKFKGDHLVPLSADVKARVDQMIAGETDLDPTPPPKKKAIYSVKNPAPPKITHKVAVAGLRSIYDAERAAYVRTCQVTGDSPNDFPSYEEWDANR
jgi:hypothetical protein